MTAADLRGSPPNEKRRRGTSASVLCGSPGQNHGPLRLPTHPHATRTLHIKQIRPHHLQRIRIRQAILKLAQPVAGSRSSTRSLAPLPPKTPIASGRARPFSPALSRRFVVRPPFRLERGPRCGAWGKAREEVAAAIVVVRNRSPTSRGASARSVPRQPTRPEIERRGFCRVRIDRLRSCPRRQGRANGGAKSTRTVPK